MKHTNFIPIDSSLRRQLPRNKGVPLDSCANWMRRMGLLLCFFFCLSVGGFAQETWLGKIDGDWTKNENWLDGSAPLSGVISGNGILTIPSTVFVPGTGLCAVLNAPTTNIPASIEATKLFMEIDFTIPATTTVTIDGSADDGVVTEDGAVLTVDGTLNVLNATDNGLVIGVDDTELINNGTIFVTNSGMNGMLLTGSGSSVNTGSFTIEESMDNGIFILTSVPLNPPLLDNLLSGEIEITESGDNGINNTGNVESSGDITIGDAGDNGILNTASIINDSLGVIAITNVDGDGINTNNTFVNAGGTIDIGDGTLANIGGNGIEVGGGTFDNFSTTSLGGGAITVNGITENGILLAGTLNNGDLPASPGDTSGVISIDNSNGNGIHVLSTGTLNNVEKSTIDIAQNEGNIRQNGLFTDASSAVNNTVAIIRLDGDNFAADANGTVTNTGILEIDTTASFSLLINEDIIKSIAPASSITGTINNTGIIIDPNNSFGSDLVARTDALNINDGVIIAPFSAECYTNTIEDFLITDLSDAVLATFNYLPSSPFTMAGNPNAATLDAANNRLILNMIQSLMDFSYTATLENTACVVDGAVSISFDNVIAPPVACNDNVQVSLDATCLAVLTVDVILEGDYSCYDGYTLEILDGTRAGSDTLDASYLGQTARVKVSSPLGNSCWGTVKVEDKVAPIIQCRDTAIYCNLSTDPLEIGGYPITSDGCADDVTFTFSDEEESFGCKPGAGSNPDTIGVVRRTWKAQDASGNTSTCVSTIHILKPQITTMNVLWPKNDTLYCGDNPDTSPEYTGYPKAIIDGDTVEIDQFCLFGLTHQDQVLTTDCEGSRKIFRTWTIYDWCHSSDAISNAISPGPQIIKVVDTVGPVISNLPVVTQIGVNILPNSCEASLTLPPITVSDECSALSNISVRILGPSSTVFSNGGTMHKVPFGRQNIIYLAEDDCGNISRDTVVVEIDDNIAPTVICKENLVISLTQNGTAIVRASAFDNGSYDNCALDSIRVRRMDLCEVDIVPLPPFSKEVLFECCDADRTTDLMVELRAWDKSGNFNSCMVNVIVQDKVAPEITCPPDVTVTCNDDLTNLDVFGPASVSGGACNNADLQLIERRNLDNCGQGIITRTWKVSDPNTAADSCTQTITVTLVPSEEFRITKIPVPDTVISCDANVDIEALPKDDLEVSSEGCQLLAVSYSQKVFVPVDACKKVIRTWEIIDWCRNPTANPALPGYRVVTQVVKLIDTLAPSFVNPLDTMFVDVDHDVCTASFTLPRMTTDDNCNNTVNQGITGNLGGTSLNGAAPEFLVQNVAPGTHKVIYTATDGCNNTTTHPLIIVVRDSEGPSIFCDDLATTLTLNASADPDSANRGWVTVWATDFNCKITDCNGDEFLQRLVFPSRGILQDTPPPDTSFGWTFNCSDFVSSTNPDNRIDIVGDLWVRDASGNWDYVRVTVNLQDNMNICNPSLPSVMNARISGTIQNEIGETVEDVTVKIGGYEMPSLITKADGNYQFVELPMHSNYTITPEKNVQPMNGVSTYDLVLISKHILGISSLDSPYKQIAADINRSGTITAYDMVQLRQLILNIKTAFTNNTSWRFVDAGYQFTTKNAEAEPFAEKVSVENLSANTEAHFVAVKVGDVSGNAASKRTLWNSEVRNTYETLTFQSSEVAFEEGTVFEAAFSLDQLTAIEGYQFTLNIDPEMVEIVTVNEGIAKAGNFGKMLIQRGQLTTSWNREGNSLNATDAKMFSLTLKAKKTGRLSEAIKVTSDLTVAEAYNTKGELLDVALKFVGQKEDASTFALYNNKPNPFKEMTTISFDLPEATDATLTIFDISGRVMTTVNREFAKGYHEVQIEKSLLKGNGIYFYQLETATHMAKKKMILIE